MYISRIYIGLGGIGLACGIPLGRIGRIGLIETVQKPINGMLTIIGPISRRKIHSQVEISKFKKLTNLANFADLPAR